MFMEMTKEKLYEVRYNTKLDKLVLKKDRLRNKFLRAVKRNKFMTVAWVAFVMFSMLNFYMIYTFMQLLQNI